LVVVVWWILILWSIWLSRRVLIVVVVSVLRVSGILWNNWQLRIALVNARVKIEIAANSVGSTLALLDADGRAETTRESAVLFLVQTHNGRLSIVSAQGEATTNVSVLLAHQLAEAVARSKGARIRSTVIVRLLAELFQKGDTERGFCAFRDLYCF
jgi:hypothetical protein